jgi:DNA-directed RNA polymerase specialized sigma24 family protein
MSPLAAGHLILEFGMVCRNPVIPQQPILQLEEVVRNPKELERLRAIAAACCHDRGLRDPHAADELLNDLVLRVLEGNAFPRFDPSRSGKLFLGGVVRQMAKDRVRHESRRRALFIRYASTIGPDDALGRDLQLDEEPR